MTNYVIHYMLHAITVYICILGTGTTLEQRERAHRPGGYNTRLQQQAGVGDSSPETPVSGRHRGCAGARMRTSFALWRGGGPRQGGAGRALLAHSASRAPEEDEAKVRATRGRDERALEAGGEPGRAPLGGGVAFLKGGKIAGDHHQLMRRGDATACCCTEPTRPGAPRIAARGQRSHPGIVHAGVGAGALADGPGWRQ